jgi:hypothetical protein
MDHITSFLKYFCYCQLHALLIAGNLQLGDNLSSGLILAEVATAHLPILQNSFTFLELKFQRP